MSILLYTIDLKCKLLVVYVLILVVPIYIYIYIYIYWTYDIRRTVDSKDIMYTLFFKYILLVITLSSIKMINVKI